MAAVFRCDFTGPTSKLPHFWEHTVDSGHALLALRADWQKQMRRSHEELGFAHVRFHGLLCDDIGTLIGEGDKLFYSFFNADQIFDFLLSIGMKPFVELSFMPGVLASGAKTVFHHRANVTPPKDYAQWAMLVRKLVAHWIERHGLAEVRQWFFEVWNEPNLGAFGSGRQDEYFKLYRYAAEAIKSVDSALKVGGPATAENAWIDDFIKFCTKSQLRLLHGMATSSNARDPMHDEPYAAAFITKTIMEANGLVHGYSYWTFSDIFEENYFPSVPFHGGFGLLNIHGIVKPAYRAFELLHALGTEMLMVEGTHPTVDAWVVRGVRSATVLLTNYALPRHPIATETMQIRLANAQSPIHATIRRIDSDHANAKRRWQEIGSSEYLDAGAIAELNAVSRCEPEPYSFDFLDNAIGCHVTLPPLAVAAVTWWFAELDRG